MLGREQMIDDVETLLAARPVNCGNVDETPEQAALVVAQERDDLDDVARVGGDGQLAVGDLLIRHDTWKRVRNRRSKLPEGLVHDRRSASALDRAGAADLLLQQQHAIKQRLRRW